MTSIESLARADGANTDRCPKQHIFVTQIDRPSSTNHLNPTRRQTFPDVSTFKKCQVAHTTTLIMMMTWPTFAPTMDGTIPVIVKPTAPSQASCSAKSGNNKERHENNRDAGPAQAASATRRRTARKRIPKDQQVRRVEKPKYGKLSS